MVAFKNSTGIKANSSFCTFRFPIAEAHQLTKPFQYQAITTALPTQPFAHFVFMPINIFSTTVHIYEHWTNRHPQFIRQFSHSSRLPTLTPPVPKQQTKTDRKQNSGQQTKLNNLPQFGIK